MTIGQILDVLARAADGERVRLQLACELYPSVVVRDAVARADGRVAVAETLEDAIVLEISGSADEFLNKVLIASMDHSRG